MTTPYLTTDIAWDEAPGGVAVLHAYGDPLTKAEPWTIGFGSTGADIHRDTVWTAQYAAERLNVAILDVIDHLNDALPWFKTLDDVRQDVLVNMGYQMGWRGLLKFTSTLAAEARGAWETVAADMQSSLWYRQTHARASRLIEQARTGVRVPREYDNTVAVTVPAVPATPAPAIPAPAQPEKENFVMSFFSKYVFDPLWNAVSRSTTSVNVAQQASGKAAAAVIAVPSAQDPSTNISDAHLSPMGQLNPHIAALETAINEAVAGYAAAMVTADVPIIGGLVAGPVRGGILAAMQFGENHAMTYLAGVFHFHTATVGPSILPDGT